VVVAAAAEVAATVVAVVAAVAVVAELRLPERPAASRRNFLYYCGKVILPRNPSLRKEVNHGQKHVDVQSLAPQ
jgi:predicted CoA-binding protein